MTRKHIAAPGGSLGLTCALIALSLAACSLEGIVGDPQASSRAADCKVIPLELGPDSTLPPEAQQFYPRVTILVTVCPKQAAR